VVAALIGEVIDFSEPAASHRRHVWRLFIGDESALPALGESLDPGECAVVYAEVDDRLEEQP
jgi:NADPH-dependent ferric siderophore reductase